MRKFRTRNFGKLQKQSRCAQNLPKKYVSGKKLCKLEKSCIFDLNKPFATIQSRKLFVGIYIPAWHFRQIRI